MTTPIPKTVGKVAKGILDIVQLNTLEQLTKVDERSLLKLHGMGPKAIEKLKDSMEEINLSILDEPLHPFLTNFLVIGDLACDNAPKRRIIRDYLILLWMKNANQLSEVLNEEVEMNRINQAKVQGIEETIDFSSKNQMPIQSLEITEILSHGKEGAAHGRVTFTSGEPLHFAEFYTFDSHKKEARIKTITSYIL